MVPCVKKITLLACITTTVLTVGSDLSWGAGKPTQKAAIEVSKVASFRSWFSSLANTTSGTVVAVSSRIVSSHACFSWRPWSTKPAAVPIPPAKNTVAGTPKGTLSRSWFEWRPWATKTTEATILITTTTVAKVSNAASSHSWRTSPKKTIDAKLAQNKHLLLGRYGNKTDEEILRDLHNKHNSTYAEMIDQGTLLIYMGDYKRASESYEMAARLARNKNEVSGALFNKAGAQAYYCLTDAQQTIDVAARLNPRNYEIVKLRYALYKLSGNKLGSAMAQDQLSRLDPNSMGHEVSLTLASVAVVAIVAASAVTVTVYALTPPENRSDVATHLLPSYYRGVIAAASIPCAGIPAFADYILENAKAV